MDKTLINTKHLMLYLSTYQVGLSILFVPEHKSLSIVVGCFELMLVFGKEVE